MIYFWTYINIVNIKRGFLWFFQKNIFHYKKSAFAYDVDKKSDLSAYDILRAYDISRVPMIFYVGAYDKSFLRWS